MLHYEIVAFSTKKNWLDVEMLNARYKDVYTVAKSMMMGHRYKSIVTDTHTHVPPITPNLYIFVTSYVSNIFSPVLFNSLMTVEHK